MERNHGIISDNSKLAQLFQESHDKALLKNEESLMNWTKSKQDHLTARSQLETLPEKLSLDVMVPIGSKALIRGKVVHTNEILVCLGAGWFVKQSAKLAAEICSRRISLCHDMLANLEKERDLLTSRKQLPFDQEVFGNEIIELYDDEVEAKWRACHREKEREYRRQLKQQRDGKKTSDSDEELWNRLEQLELQEELQKELDILHDHQSLYEDTLQQQQQPPTPKLKPNICNVSTSQKLNEQPIEEISQNPKRRVSFVDEQSAARSSNIEDGDRDSSDEPLYIHFSHSPILGQCQRQPNASDGQIRTPADIYKLLPKHAPRSILKQTAHNQTSIVHNTFDLPSLEQRGQFQSALHKSNACEVDVPLAFGDVIEHDTEEATHGLKEIQSAHKRPVSRFRAARLPAAMVNK